MVTFYLDNKDTTEKPIFLNLRHGGQRFRVPVGRKIDPSQWDVKACRANPRKYKNNCVGFNAYLQGISDEVTSLVNENKGISRADLKAIVDKANGKETTDSFFGFAESYIEQQIKKGELLPLSAKAYQGTLNHLREINPRLDFKDVDLNFYDKFVAYLRTEGLSTNSIGGHIKRLKWFMSAALDRGLHSNLAFKKKSFKTTREETDQIYLTRKEIKQLAKKSLQNRLKRVADAFVINCYLGMRFSDLDQIQKQNFKKEGNIYMLNMVQGKTGEKVVIPVPPEAVPLLRKYKFSCPVVTTNKLISVQKFNDYLKDAAKDAELEELVDIRENGSVKKYPKHELIKSHTARRTFATNLYLEGVAIQNIMAITGHKKEETFLLYVRADQLTKAKGLATHYQRKGRTTMKVSKGGKAA